MGSIFDSLLLNRTEKVTVEEAVHIARDAMTSACERDIHTGDDVEIVIITKDGVKREKYFMASD